MYGTSDLPRGAYHKSQESGRLQVEPYTVPIMTVHTNSDGPVAVITIDRPEVRNAVDRNTA